MSSAKQATAAGQEPSVRTATVERGKLSDQVSQSGILTYRAQLDGSPYTVFNQARGTYTKLPGERRPGRLRRRALPGQQQAGRAACAARRRRTGRCRRGATGPDVAELNANLVDLGYATHAQLDRSSDSFSAATASALGKLQGKLGEDQTGSLDLGQVVFLPESVRIATVTGELGASAQPGAQALSATSETLEVQLALDPSQQGEVKKGDRAQITLPSNTSVTGRVNRLGRVAQVPAGQNTGAGGATIPVYIGLDAPRRGKRTRPGPGAGEHHDQGRE